MAALEEAYRRPGHPIAFSGRNQLSRNYTGRIEDFLSTVDAYTQHRQGKKPRQRNPIFVYQTRELIQVDLADVRSLAKYNNNVHYLLLCIDSFSRFAWVKALKEKTGPTVTAAMKEILQEMNPKPKRCLSDAGKEFVSRSFRNLLDSFGIAQTITNAEVKAPHVERFTATLKKLMYMYMTERETRSYLNQLDDLLKSYNTRGHRSLDFLSPEEADLPENREKVLEILNKKYEKVIFSRPNHKPKFKVGDVVRLRIYHPTFNKGHRETFTAEMFKIKEVVTNLPIVQYIVHTYNEQETIRGRFYESELQLCTGEVFKVEKILKRRMGPNSKVQFYVKWLNFGPEYNSWINEDDIADRYE